MLWRVNETLDNLLQESQSNFNGIHVLPQTDDAEEFRNYFLWRSDNFTPFWVGFDI